MPFAGYLLQGAALITQARFIDQRAKAVVIPNHLCPRRRKPVAEYGLGNTQDSRRFLSGKSQNFLQHQCGLLFRRQRARNTRKTKRDVFANFEAESRPLHDSGKPRNFLRISRGFLLADQLRFHAPALLRPQMVQTNMRRDPEKPAFEPRFTAIRSYSFQHAHQHVLQQVFRVLPQHHHPVDVAEKRLAPRLHQRPERQTVSLLRFFHQLHFFLQRDFRKRMHRHFSLLGEDRAAPVYNEKQNWRGSFPCRTNYDCISGCASCNRLPEGSRNVVSLTMPGISSILPSNFTPAVSKRSRSCSMFSPRSTIVAPGSFPARGLTATPMLSSPSEPANSAHSGASNVFFKPSTLP